MNIENAIIESSNLYIEDHGILTISLILKLPCGGVSFGGFNLGYSREDLTKCYCGYWVEKILEVCSVSDWKDLQGKVIRAKFENNMIIAIGHPIKDIWFEPRVI